MSFEYKYRLKELLPDYMDLLEEQGMIENRGNNYWTCPFCDSGNNQNHSAAFHINGTRYKCFSCNKHGDIFDLVAYIEKLPNDWKKHYNRTLQIMRPYLEKVKSVKSEHIKKSEVKKEEDYRDYLHECHKNIDKTDYFIKRGLSKEIIDRFNLGYDINKNLVTIPYNPDYKGYVHRVLWDAENKYCKYGNEIFNVDALYADNIHDDRGYVFVTEGQIDAMSFEEIGLRAIGLGGTNEITRLTNQLKNRPCNKILVLAMDNDRAGRRATGKLIEGLAEDVLDQDYIVYSHLYGKYKDANEYLIADKEGFKKRMIEIIR